MPHRSRSAAILVLVIAMASVQSGASLAKQLFPSVGPLGATALRLVFAAAILGAIWRPWRQRLTRSERHVVLGYGAALGVMNLSFYLALDRIPLGVAVALEFTGPLAIALLASRQPRDFVWAALAAAGIVCLLPVTSSTTTLDWLGVLYALIAAVCWALYIVFGQRAGAALHGGTATAYGMLVAAAVAVPVCLVLTPSTLLTTLSTGSVLVSVLPLALVVAVLSSALPYSLEMIALQRLPAKTFGILMSVEPAIGATAGLILLHERLSNGQWLAIACIIIASVGSTTSAPSTSAVRIEV